MSLSLLNVKITECTFDGKECLIDYSLTSLTSTSLFLVQDQDIPFLRITPDKMLLEIWLGIPPQTEIEKNLLINALILPDTFELAPNTIINKTTSLEYPFKKSGYWLERSEETVIPLKNKTRIKAKVIQGFGTSKIGPQKVRSIHELYTWQLTTQSQVVEFQLTKGT